MLQKKKIWGGVGVGWEVRENFQENVQEECQLQLQRENAIVYNKYVAAVL